MVGGSVLDRSGKVSVLIQQQGKTPTTPDGWDLAMTSEPPERANKVLNKAIQEISAKKRANVEARRGQCR